MWVICNNRIGILTKLDSLCEVHLTDSITGENVAVETVPLTSLRQARWLEIPEKRRMISAEKALELGYGA